VNYLGLGENKLTFYSAFFSFFLTLLAQHYYNHKTPKNKANQKPKKQSLTSQSPKKRHYTTKNIKKSRHL
jgi:hypothetical protein